MLIKDMVSFTDFPIKEIQITDKLAQIGEEADSPMKCDIMNIKVNDIAEDVYCLYLDFKPYEEYNKSVAVPSFWDINHKPTLTWFESGYYKDGKVEIYVQGSDEFNTFFIKKEVKTKYDLQEEFTKETNIWINSNTNYPYQYAEWLENKIIKG